MKLTSPFNRFPTRLHSQLLRLTLPLLLASCGTLASREIKTDPCAGWSPIYASKADTLTDGTAKQILAHDCHGIAVKCWKDPTPKGKPPVCPKITR